MAVSKTNINLDIAKRLDLTCRKGDSFELSMAVTDANGTEVDFSTYTDIKLQVRPTDEDTGVPVLEFTYPTDFNTSTLGLLIVSKSSASMATIAAGIYVYDMQLTDATGKTVTWFYGLFKINDDISF